MQNIHIKVYTVFFIIHSMFFNLSPPLSTLMSFFGQFAAFFAAFLFEEPYVLDYLSNSLMSELRLARYSASLSKVDFMATLVRSEGANEVQVSGEWGWW